MSEQLIELVYTSNAIDEISQNDLDDILASSRMNNHEHDITGMLTYDDEVFLQILEGPRTAVMSLLNKIQKDPRHFNVSILYQSNIEERAFGNWQMAFKQLEARRTLIVTEQLSPYFSDYTPASVRPNMPNVGKELFLIYRD